MHGFVLNEKSTFKIMGMFLTSKLDFGFCVVDLGFCVSSYVKMSAIGVLTLSRCDTRTVGTICWA